HKLHRPIRLADCSDKGRNPAESRRFAPPNDECGWNHQRLPELAVLRAVLAFRAKSQNDASTLVLTTSCGTASIHRSRSEATTIRRRGDAADRKPGRWRSAGR